MAKRKIRMTQPAVKRFIVMQMPNVSYTRRFDDNEQLNGERFSTRDEALEAIKNECDEMIVNENELRVGLHKNYLMRYAIYEMVEEMAFDVRIAYKIIRRENDGPSEEETETPTNDAEKGK